VILLFWVSRELIYLPFLTIDAPQSTIESIKLKLEKNSFMDFTFIWRIRVMKLEDKIPYCKNFSIRRISFLKWKMDIVQEIFTYLVKLNGYHMSVDKDGFLIRENSKEIIDVNSLVVFVVNIRAKSDAKVVFNEYVRPFLIYTTTTKSKLNPMILEIDFDDFMGLSFISYDKKRIILGKRKDFELIENEIFNAKSLLMEKKEYTNYNELDFRFSNRIICRK